MRTYAYAQASSHRRRPGLWARARRKVIHADQIPLERDGERIGLPREDVPVHSLRFLRYLVECDIEVAVKLGRNCVGDQMLAVHPTRSTPQRDPPVRFVHSLPPQRVDGVAVTGGAAHETIAEIGSAGTAAL
jgi:hypothetical protein